MDKLYRSYIVFVTFLSFVCVGCSSTTKETAGEIPFTINPFERRIRIPMLLNDSIIANLDFDTGAPRERERILLDSIFCTEHPSIAAGLLPAATVRGGSSWSPVRLPYLVFDTPLNVKLGSRDYEYKGRMIADRRKYMGDNDSDGLFNIPLTDTAHVWELNFEHNYLKIHSTQNFVMPAQCFVTPFVRDELNKHWFSIQLPIKIETLNEDTLSMNHTYLVDTGMPHDMALMCRAGELSFFNEQKNAIWIKDPVNYTRYYTVNATLLDKIDIDSLRIYTFDYPNYIRQNYLIGLNFLKRFNVFFDMKNQRLGLQPIPNFQRIVNPLLKRFHIGFTRTANGKIIVSKVADYEENYFKTAGFQEGDEGIAVNGKPFNKLTPEDDAELGEQEVLHYDILRGGRSMKITVHVDKNEVQGD